MGAGSLWGKVRALEWPDHLLLTEAVVLLPVLSVALRLFGFRRVYSALNWFARPPASQTAPQNPVALDAIGRVSHLVDVAARRGVYHPTCLERSLVLWALLRQRHVESGLRIGVRLTQAGFEAHAWVEYQGAVVNDAPDIAQTFAPFDRLISPEGASWR